MHHSHRTWFPFILVGLSLALSLVIIVFTQGSHQGVENKPLSEVQYQEAVLFGLDDYKQNVDAQKMYWTLLDMHVCEACKDVHLELVLLFGKLLSGEVSSADAVLLELDQHYPWLIDE